MKRNQIALVAGLILLFLSCSNAPAHACQRPNGERSSVVVQIQFGSLRVPWVVNLTWPEPLSVAAEPGTTCAIGLNAGVLTRLLGVEVFRNGSGFPFEAFGQFQLDQAASLAAGARLGGRWLVFTSTLAARLPAEVPVNNAFQAVAPPGTTFRNVVNAYGNQPVFLTGEFDPARGTFAPERFHVTAGDEIDFLSGMARERATDALIETACDPDAHPNARNAASIAVATRWLQVPPPREALYRYSADPARPPECRMMAFEAQVAALFSLGDPRIGPPLGPDTGQRYADAVAEAPTPERAYVLATGVARLVREGFAIVPGGVEESFRRLQTCLLDGRIETSQANRVEGVALDCGVEAVRRAVGDSIGTSFYVAFRENPFVELSCQDLRAQAEDGPHVAARWAAAKALVFDARCTPNTVNALSDLAVRANSAEMRQATVRPLAELLTVSGTAPETLLFNAASAATAELRQAYGWAAGILLSSRAHLVADADCRANTRVTGLLENWAAASIGGQPEPGLAAVAPLARFDVSKIVDVNQGVSCSFQRAGVELRLRLSRPVPGAALPLDNFILLGV